MINIIQNIILLLISLYIALFGIKNIKTTSFFIGLTTTLIINDTILNTKLSTQIKNEIIFLNMNYLDIYRIYSYLTGILIGIICFCKINFLYYIQGGIIPSFIAYNICIEVDKYLISIPNYIEIPLMVLIFNIFGILFMKYGADINKLTFSIFGSFVILYTIYELYFNIYNRYYLFEINYIGLFILLPITFIIQRKQKIIDDLSDIDDDQFIELGIIVYNI